MLDPLEAAGHHDACVPGASAHRDVRRRAPGMVSWRPPGGVPRASGDGRAKRPERVSDYRISMRRASASFAFGRRTVSTPSATLAEISSLAIFVDSVKLR